MMERILWLDYTKSKKNLVLKMSLPFLLVFASYQMGFGNLALVMVLIFTVITGAGLKIVQLKNEGVYNRLIAAPISKRRLFLELTSVSIGLYFLQFLPTLLLGVYYNHMEMLMFSFLSIVLVVLIGTLVGIHAKSFGQIHLNSLITVLPLAAVAIVPVFLSYFFPFIYIVKSVYSWGGFLLSSVVIIGFFSVLLVDVSRL
jgi:hypothetical protein